MRDGKAFAARLVKARARLGLSQHALGESMGMAQAQISRYELGQVPRSTTVVKLAECLNVTYDWLIGESGEDAQAPITLRVVLTPDLHAWVMTSAKASGVSPETEIATILERSMLLEREGNLSK